MIARLKWCDAGEGWLEAVTPKGRYLCMAWHDGKILVKFVPSAGDYQELGAVDTWDEAKGIAQAHFNELMTDFG